VSATSANNDIGQVKYLDAETVQSTSSSLFDPAVPQHPNGTLLWRTMRSFDTAVSAKPQEPIITTGSIFEIGNERLDYHDPQPSAPCAEPNDQVVEAEITNFTIQQPFSLDAKLVGQAQCSLFALDQVFTHMTSCFMEQVDFNQIDFEVIAQA
jgi:hypothetical protein